MEERFTSGEWEVSGETIWCNGRPVCCMGDSWVTYDNARVNAHLIAAAPKMYAMLKQVAQAEDADLEALKYLAVVWVRDSKNLLAEVRGG